MPSPLVPPDSSLPPTPPTGQGRGPPTAGPLAALGTPASTALRAKGPTGPGQMAVPLSVGSEDDGLDHAGHS
jgi:hypothetical protein